MNIYDSITEILRSTEKFYEGDNNILPSSLYNEGWMLRLVLDWFSKNRKYSDFDISFNKNARWFSEGRLTTIFNKSDKGLGEGYTSVDGVYGNFTVGTQDEVAHNNVSVDKGKHKSIIRLDSCCQQFVVIEAKMFSDFSKGVSNCPQYNQVARTLACMSYVLCKSKKDFQSVKKTAFYAFLPEKEINKKTINLFKQKEIKKTVYDRLQKYKDHKSYSAKEKWYNDTFSPFVDNIPIKIIKWEKILEHIKTEDNSSYKVLNDFYDKCRLYSGKEAISVDLKLID